MLSKLLFSSSSTGTVHKPSVDAVLRRTEGLERAYDIQPGEGTAGSGDTKPSSETEGSRSIVMGDDSDDNDDESQRLSPLQHSPRRSSPLSRRSRSGSRVLDSVERLTTRMSQEAMVTDTTKASATEGTTETETEASNGHGYAAAGDVALSPNAETVPEDDSSDSDLGDLSDLASVDTLPDTSGEVSRSRLQSVTRGSRPLMIRRASGAGPAARPLHDVSTVEEV